MKDENRKRERENSDDDDDDATSGALSIDRLGDANLRTGNVGGHRRRRANGGWVGGGGGGGSVEISPLKKGQEDETADDADRRNAIGRFRPDRNGGPSHSAVATPVDRTAGKPQKPTEDEVDGPPRPRKRIRRQQQQQQQQQAEEGDPISATY